MTVTDKALFSIQSHGNGVAPNQTVI